MTGPLRAIMFRLRSLCYGSDDSSARGVSMLEFAMTLPVLLFTTTAALDITAVLQARSALQQATTTSLRCIYPVDGACLATTRDERSRLYEFYVLPDSGDNGFIFSRDNFSGRAKFFEAPRRALENFRSPLLGSVFFDFEQASYRVSGQIPGMAVEYRVMRELAQTPYLTGSDPRNPTFTIRDNGAPFPAAPSSADPLAARVLIPASVNGSGTVVSLAPEQTATGWQSAFTYSIPRPNVRALCLGQHCNLINGASTKLAFHLKGSSSSSGPGGCGRVEIRLLSSSGTQGLGGQTFGHGTGGSESANFYPRGIPRGDVPPAWLEGREGPTEWDHGQPTPRFGHSYSIQVRLVRTSGLACSSANAISWSASGVDLYTPVFEREEDRRTACTPPSEGAEQPGQCVPRHSDVHADYFVRPPSISDDPSLSSSVSVEIPAAVSPTHAVHQVLTQNFGSAATAAAGAGLTPVLVRNEAPRTFSLPCPENFGVPQEANSVPGSTPARAIRNSPQAHQACPADPALHAEAAEAVPFQPVVTNVRWSETNARVVPHAPVEWTKINCSIEPPQYDDLPAALRAYPREKLRWDNVAATAPAFEIITTGRELSGNPANDPSDPDVIKRTDPLFACSDLRVGSIIYNDSNRAIRRNSLFVGTHDNIDACDRGAILRNAAESTDSIPAPLRLQADMFFSPDTPRTMDRVETEVAPADPCVAFQVREGQIEGLGTKVAGGPFPDGTTPVECSGTNNCRRLFAGFGSGSPSESVILSERAEELGRQELFAAVPWTARLCGETQCGQVTISEDQPLPGMVTSTARANVRLTTLLGKSVTLEHSHREKLESELVRAR